MTSAKKRGVVYLLFQTLVFAIAGVTSAFLQKQAKIPTFEVYFFQLALALIFLLPWLFKQKFHIKRAEASKALIARVIASTICVTCLFVAVKNIPATTAFLLFNTGPLYVPFIFSIWHKEPLSFSKVLFTAIGFLGIFLILNPQYHELSLYDFIAILSGVAGGFVVTTTHSVVRQKVLERSIFFILFVSLIGTIPFMLVQFEPIAFSWWPYLVVLGGAWALVQYTFVGYVHAHAASLAPLLFFTVVFSGVMEFFVFGYGIDLFDIIGAFFVILGSILVITD